MMRCSKITRGSLANLHFDLLGIHCHVLCMPLYFTNVVVTTSDGGQAFAFYIILAFS